MKANERIKEQMARYRSDDPVVKAKATEEIVDDYRKFISHVITKHFSSYMSKYYEDMFSYGVIGLLEALPRFDPEKSMPTTFFASYIFHEIFNFVGEFVGQTTQHYAVKMSRVNKAKAELINEGIEHPTVMDLAMRSGLKPEVVMKVMSIQTMAQTQSYDSEEFIFSNMEADSSLQPDVLLLKKEEAEVLRKAVEELPDKMREIVKRKLGIGEYEAQSVARIGKEMGIPPGGVRHFFSKAMDLLRETEVFDFFASRYRSSSRFKRDSIAIVSEETAERLISTLLEFDGSDDEQIN